MTLLTPFFRTSLSVKEYINIEGHLEIELSTLAAFFFQYHHLLSTRCKTHDHAHWNQSFWSSLAISEGRSSYCTSRKSSVDAIYGTPAGLPFALQGLFDNLVDAYLNGHWVEGEEDVSTSVTTTKKPQLTPAMAEALQRRQRKAMKPTAASEAATYIIHDRVKCWA